MSELDPRVQALIDKDEIREVIYRFSRGVDRHDWELAASCYHDDGIDDHGVFTGPATEYIPWVAENLPNMAEMTQHFVGNIMIELDGDVAHVESYVVGYHRYSGENGSPRDFTGGARYVDRFERRDGVWAIAHRLLVWEWVRDDPVDQQFEGFGLDATPFAWGAHGREDPVYTHGGR